MIGISVKYVVKKGEKENFLKLMAELCSKSRQERENVTYELGKVLDTENTYLLLERWNNPNSLAQHEGLEHFTTLVPQIDKLCDEKVLVKSDLLPL